MSYVKWFDDIGSGDVAEVGGKNASLGEMIAELAPQGIRIPRGFATTAEAYRQLLDHNDLTDRIRSLIDRLRSGNLKLETAGKKIRRLFSRADIPEELAAELREAYRKLSETYDSEETDVAVRSSATAEDLPEASFAGQQETFLNVTGEDELLEACRKCYRSLFTDRAISYREEKGFDHLDVALSVGVQKMVRADRAGSGVMFSIDTETGFPDVVVINAAWGLGEPVVQGSVNPDEYRVFKPLLGDDDRMPIIQKERGSKERKMIYSGGGSTDTKMTDTSAKERAGFVLDDGEIRTLARWAVAIEKHYDKPMDMEWAKDAESGDLFIVQARPETVQSLKSATQMKSYRLKEDGTTAIEGLAIGEAIAAGPAQIIHSADDIDKFEDNAILVTGQTDPDWVPIMKKAAAIVTDHGGRTSHAAIVSRELGIPAVVGTGDATSDLSDGDAYTVSCAEGDRGMVYKGTLEFEEKDLDLADIPETRTNIMMNIASPAGATRWWRLPAEGIGLARMEFIINNIIKIHPLALARYDSIEDTGVKKKIDALTRGYDDMEEYFVEHLARGIARIAAAQHPHPVIVRMSDFKTSEYANLIGGAAYEPEESNPMLGFRGASRYYSDRYRDGFRLECRGIRRAREEIGLDNIVIMIPFCRSIAEADRVLEALAENGLERGKHALKVYVMVEIPSNVILAEEFAQRFDGFSIGTNDLTQLVLGVDRDSEELSEVYDERNDAVKRMIHDVIERAHRHNRPVGICGQAPSDYPDFAAFLVEEGIDSISLNPDSVLDVRHRVHETELALEKQQ